uniref:RNA pseudouridine synthase n=1 Tax=uncultured Halomonas sp. TaxID=173971 RepID=UPI002608C52E|nr:RNA pseudouridine synthase [uncultured Halomonas sp.]
MNDTHGEERLSKRLARELPCSRREAELYIAGGWVSVDGRVVEEPQFKVVDQVVALLPGATPREISPATLLYHCPADIEAIEGEDLARRVIRKATHWPEDPAGKGVLKAHFRGLVSRLPLGPAEAGLMVFTQDRGVLRRLEEKRSRLEEEWLIDVTGRLDEHGLAALREGAALPGQHPTALKVSWQSEDRLRFAAKGAKPGQLEAMCRAVGLGVVASRRLRMGGVSLGAVPAGQWRYLRRDERF